MAWTQDQLDKLEEAIAQGTLRVKYADKEVTYRSLAEMMQIREVMRAALGKVDASAGTRSYPTTSKGLTSE